MPLTRIPAAVSDIAGLNERIDILDQRSDRMFAAGELIGADREGTFGLANVAATSGRLFLHYFTAERTETCNLIEMWNGTVAAAPTPTLIRIGFWAIDAAGSGVLVCATDHSSSIFAAVSTAYSRTLIGGFAKIRGQRYAMGLLVVSSVAVPTPYSRSTSAFGGADTVLGRSPKVAGTILGLTDLPSSFDSSAVANSRVLYSARITP